MLPVKTIKKELVKALTVRANAKPRGVIVYSGLPIESDGISVDILFLYTSGNDGLGDSEALELDDGEVEADGLKETESEALEDGEGLKLTETEGDKLTDLDSLEDGEGLKLTDLDSDKLALEDGEGLKDGLRDSEDDGE